MKGYYIPILDVWTTGLIDVLRRLMKAGHIQEFHYNLNDKYETLQAISLGSTAGYSSGHIKTLQRWVEEMRNQNPLSKDKSDLQLIYYIISHEKFWKKVEL